MSDIEALPRKAEHDLNSDEEPPQEPEHGNEQEDKSAHNAPPPSKFPTPPDGGIVAWLQVVGAFCMWFGTL
jgi:hypothetical protein